MNISLAREIHELMQERTKVVENTTDQFLYIKDRIFRNILLLSCARERFPSFCVIHAHTEESCICELCCYCGMQRSKGIHGWSLCESVGDWAVSHPGNSIVDRKIGTRVARLGCCLHYYDAAPPFLRIHSVSGSNGKTKRNETTRVIVRKYDRTNSARRVNVSYVNDNLSILKYWAYWNIRLYMFIWRDMRWRIHIYNLHIHNNQ